jgi:hypothetical protein
MFAAAAKIFFVLADAAPKNQPQKPPAVLLRFGIYFGLNGSLKSP